MTLVIDPKPGIRVRVTNPGHPLDGKTGETVCVAHQLDNMIWVNMDEDLPDKYVNFAGRFDSRKNWVLSQPEDLEETT